MVANHEGIFECVECLLTGNYGGKGEGIPVDFSAFVVHPLLIFFFQVVMVVWGGVGCASIQLECI